MSLFYKEKVLIKFPAKNKGAIPLVLTYPNSYSVGMTSLGFQNAWTLFNQSENISVTRWFTDIQEKSGLPPRYVGFSLSWELDCCNIFSILEKNKISIYSKERKEVDPIIFCGGQVPNANPDSFCEFFDFFLVGDLEVLVKDLIDKIIETKNLKREEKLNELGKLPGVYVPCRDAINCISTKREFTKGNLSCSSIITPNSIWPNTFLVEVVRSCPELCRFCLASYGSLPFRTPGVKESLIPLINFGLKYTNKIGLLGASVTQHPGFEILLDHLLSKHQSLVSSPKSKINVQIASVRADTISKHLTEGLFKLGAKSITMAVETGSEKLRDIINKKVSNETIFNSIQTIYNAGFKSIKLYGMVGLPFETQDDLEETVKFLKILKSKTKNLKIVWSCSIFVPKAQTPFQWYGIDRNAGSKIKYLTKELHKIGVDFRHESYKWSVIQALISRGDRSISKILEKAYRYGFTLGGFNKAIKEGGLDLNQIVFSNWEITSKLPWENVQGYLNKEVVKSHV